MSDASQSDSWLSRNKLTVAPWFFLAPALVFFSIYVVIPIFESISLSFCFFPLLSEIIVFEYLIECNGNTAS